jgi:hypothetical protein
MVDTDGRTEVPRLLHAGCLDDTKSAAGKRTLPLPRFAVGALTARRRLPFLGEQSMIFTSTAGIWRDPNNFNKQGRQVRDGVGVAGVTTHSFARPSPP